MALKCFEGTNVPIVDVIRSAKSYYISEDYLGMCECIKQSLANNFRCNSNEIYKYFDQIELFKNSIAIEKFNGRLAAFWWPTEHKNIRISYFNWLISEYSKEI